MRQQPMTAKRVVFVTIEDEFGVANVVVYAHVSSRDRVALLTSRLMLVKGRVDVRTSTPRCRSCTSLRHG